MTEYVVLLAGSEAGWAAATEEQRAATYRRHGEFAAALAERGHTITGGAELTHSSGSVVVRVGADGPVVTEGPYAETVEQLTGFYIVQSDDPDDLAAVCAILADAEGVVEIRSTVVHDAAQPAS